MKRKKVVVLTGAGISAESGIPTFRASDGLWSGYRVEEVATFEAWKRNPALVQQFYNDRRKQALTAKPNRGHKVIAELEKYFDVTVITQNIDNLHERAGSSDVLHLHGEITKSRSTLDENLVYLIDGWELKIGDKCERGSQLRPHIVWFGEAVPMMEKATEITLTADIFLVVGTSLVVYPAASLLDYVEGSVAKYIVDPDIPNVNNRPNLFFIEQKASLGLRKVKDELIEKYVINA
ncbi:NAD-dependent deacylase [Rapidithrix thailandica]|uniref:NAD-dependent protein deacylase n=1 Tax=Rapidithrix thailandica TaxID=413964 RepID=A0AAW9SCD2_9BACT